MKRTCIALDIPFTADTRMFLAEVKKRFDAPGMKWVNIDNMHLTLQFIGDTPTEQEDAIIRLLEELVPGFPVFELSLKGLGIFPHKKNPRVGWLGVEDEPVLADLQQVLSEKLPDAGVFVEPRIFVPHLTFVRLKHYRQHPAFMQFVRENAKRRFHSVFIDSVRYYASELTPKGAVYTLIRSVALG